MIREEAQPAPMSREKRISSCTRVYRESRGVAQSLRGESLQEPSTVVTLVFICHSTLYILNKARDTLYIKRDMLNHPGELIFSRQDTYSKVLLVSTRRDIFLLYVNVIYIEESETRAQKDEDEKQHANASKLIFARGIPANYHFSRLDGASRIVPRSSSTFASFVIDVDSVRPSPMYRTRHFADCPVFRRRNRLKTAMLRLSHETRVFKRIIVEEERAGERQTRASCVRTQPRTEGRLRPREAITYFDLRGTHRDYRLYRFSRVPTHSPVTSSSKGLRVYYATSRLTNVFCVFRERETKDF